MTDQEIIEELAKIDGVFEVYQVVSRFQLHRNAKDGNVQEITVEVFDAGLTANEAMRYHVFARANDGRTATGNPDSSIEMALMHMHWEHLDFPLVEGENQGLYRPN